MKKLLFMGLMGVYSLHVQMAVPVYEPLLVAINNENPQQVKEILQRECAKIPCELVNRQDISGKTPLLMVTQNSIAKGEITDDAVKIVRLLIEYGADPTIKDNDGAMTKDYEHIFYLSKGTPLHWAAAEDDEGAVLELIKISNNIDARDEGQRTPLMVALSLTNLQHVARLLLSNGANVNAQDQYKQTPLMHAISNPNIDISMIESLLIKGANPNITDRNGRSALSYAMDLEKNKTGIVKVLLEYTLPHDLSNLSHALVALNAVL